jgi:hypothetical protein
MLPCLIMIVLAMPVLVFMFMFFVMLMLPSDLSGFQLGRGILDGGAL